MPFVFSFLLGAFLSCIWLSLSGGSTCRCRPGESCWPSPSEWAALNTTLRGDLVEVRPIAHICHDPFYDHSACQNLRDLAKDSGWRASQAGMFIRLLGHFLDTHPHSGMLTDCPNLAR